MSDTPALIEALTARFGDTLLAVGSDRGQFTIEVAADQTIDVMRALRDEKNFRFAQLIDLCGVDYLSYGQSEWETDAVTDGGFSRGVSGEGPGRFAWANRPRVAGADKRFAVVVHLLSIEHNWRLRVRYFAPDDTLPIVPSLVDIWSGANWFEREAFDLFGIVFEGHPDLRRLLTDYGFVGHPFRKDFPLIGNVEVRYDAVKGRVVYEPVSIEPRVGVPRVVREDSRYLQAQNELAQKAN
jgi:NADH-quinone oxidoreductase subunit C